MKSVRVLLLLAHVLLTATAPALREALHDPSRDVREFARQAIEKIGRL
jgi:hypothetical protein